MANLMVKRADPTEAGAELVASIREALPNTGVMIRTLGEPEQRSVLGAIGHELGGYFRTTESWLFAVTAEASSPRPLRVDCRYVAVGRGAGPASILYLARLRHLIPGAVGFRRGKFRSGEFHGEPAVAAALSAVPGLGSTVWQLLQPSVVYGSTVLTIEPMAELVPDEEGALFGAVSAPARKTFGLGGYRLDLTSFLDIANRLDAALDSVPGAALAPRMNVPLPGASETT